MGFSGDCAAIENRSTRSSSSELSSRKRRLPRQSAVSAAFNVALGRIAADVFAESGR